MSRPLNLLLASCALLAMLATGPVRLDAVQPSLRSISPYGFQRGGQFDVQFSGARLGDVEQLLFYSPGIKVKTLEKVNDNNVKATLQIAADCRLGIHAVRVRTASGISDLRTFSVGAMPEVQEKEPNNDFAAPQPIDMNCTVNGVVLNEDVDYFVVEVKKGRRLVAELEGVRLGNTFFDPYLAILNAERFELSRSDDAALLWQDCLCSIIAPKDGTYIIQVRESAYGGDGNCKYRLHVGDFPRPTAVVPAGGRPGETVEVRWLGDPAGPWTEKITLPDEENPQFELFATNGQSISPSPNRIRVVDLQNTMETEPNDTPGQATPAAGLGALNGVIEKPGDVDFFQFAAKKGQSFDFRVYSRNTLRSPLDSLLAIQRSNGANVAGNDDSDGPDSYIRFTAPADDQYFVSVRDHLGGGGPDYAYRLEAAPRRPQLTMGLPEKQRYVSTTVSVPRGNRAAVMVTASRANFGGEIAVDVTGAPAGLALQAPVMASNQTSVPILFTAAADAAAGGALADLVGRPVEEGLKVVGHLDQRTMLVRGQNNRDVWGHNADRMAIAVTTEAPFQINIVQPQVPVVRNGSMQLKVAAVRADGFDAPITVRLLYNPPGIAASASISIPQGRSEAAIPLTANNGAAIGKWPIVVIGEANYGGGRVEAATQMAELEIADSLFNFAFQKAAGELGGETSLVVKVEHKSQLDEVAKVELAGLPANTSTTSEPVELTKEDVELVFPIKIAAEASPNTYKSLVCRAVVIRNGEPIMQTLGGGELRIDRSLPPKAEASQPKAPSKPRPKVAKTPAAKPLSRLEQLRLRRKQEQEAGSQDQGSSQ